MIDEHNKNIMDSEKINVDDLDFGFLVNKDKVKEKPESDDISENLLSPSCLLEIFEKTRTTFILSKKGS